MNTCPKCGKTYSEHPALSRADNRTLICPACSTVEALDIAGFSDKDKEQVMSLIDAISNGMEGDLNV